MKLKEWSIGSSENKSIIYVISITNSQIKHVKQYIELVLDHYRCA